MRYKKKKMYKLIFIIAIIGLAYFLYSFHGINLGLDLQGGAHIVLEAEPTENKEITDEVMSGLKNIMERRVNQLGLTEPVIQIQGNKRIIVDLPAQGDSTLTYMFESDIDRGNIENILKETELSQDFAVNKTNIAINLSQEINQADEDKAEIVQIPGVNRIFVKVDNLISKEDINKIKNQFENEMIYNNSFKGEFIQTYKFESEVSEIDIEDILLNSELSQGFNVDKLTGSENNTSIIQISSNNLISEDNIKKLQNSIKDKYPEATLNEAKSNFSYIFNKNLTEKEFADVLTKSEVIKDFDIEKKNVYVNKAQEKVNEASVIKIPGVTITTNEYITDTDVKRIKKALESKYVSTVEYRNEIYSAEEAIETIGRTAMLTFRNKNDEVVMSGDVIKGAEVIKDQSGVGWAVSLNLTSEGQKKFAEVTGRLKGQRMAIYLDNEELTNPYVKEKITTSSATIDGYSTAAEAREDAILIREGSLPVPVKIRSFRTVGPTLGKLAINKSLTAGLIGLLLVGIYMVFYYRFPGVLAAVILAIYGLFLLGTLAGLQATLTLPGIAGLILSIGMAVDANIIIFERIKDEIKSGKTLRSAIDAGFKRAYTTILDANVTTIITAVILAYFTSGTVRGFAVTLGIGVTVSMFTAFFVTRNIIDLFSDTDLLHSDKAFGVRGGQ